jgi:hypothetical protein
MIKLIVYLVGLCIAVLTAAAQIPVPPGFPNENNTGIIGAGLTYSDLKPAAGMAVTVPGAVIEGYDFEGGVSVKADNVTIRKCRITFQGFMGVFNNGSYKNLLIEDCEIVGKADADGMYGKGIGWSHYTARRCNVWNCQDGAAIQGDCVVEDCYIHDLVKFIDKSGGWSHNDALQSTGGSNIIVRHNTLRTVYQGATSALRFVAETAEVNNAVAENNFFSGGAATIYVYGKTGYNCPSNTRITNNVFEKNSYIYWPVYPSGFGCGTASCNRWHTGELMDEKVYPGNTCNSTSVVAALAISPNGGTFDNSVQVTLTCATTGADIYYTTDGSTPTTSSAKYTGPFTLTASALVKAMAAKSGMTDSPASIANFTVNTGSAGDTYTIEAEDMTLNGYVVDNGTQLSGTAIKVEGTSGIASVSFTGTAGVYTLTLWAIPENDGQPTIILSVDGKQVLNRTLPMDAAYYNYKARGKYEVTNVTLAQGSTIEIKGTADAEAYARVDKIVLVKTGTTGMARVMTGLKGLATARPAGTLLSITGEPVNGKPMRPGVYFYRQETGGQVWLEKRVIIK